MAVLLSGRGVEVVGLVPMVVTEGVVVATEGRNATTELAIETNISINFATAALVPSKATLEEGLFMIIAGTMCMQRVADWCC